MYFVENPLLSVEYVKKGDNKSVECYFFSRTFQKLIAISLMYNLERNEQHYDQFPPSLGIYIHYTVGKFASLDALNTEGDCLQFANFPC